MKPLQPTMRETKRYLVYELITQRPVGMGEGDVLRHLSSTLGLFDGAKAGVLPVRYDEKTQTGVLRVNHTSVDKVKAALLLLKTVGGAKAIARVRGVSGVLNKTQRFLPEQRTIIEND
jgi:ribonuclease P/MRP protein subunit POP5